MSGDTNIKTIGQIYQAFGRGDLATIMDAVTDDIDSAAEAASPAAPWYGAVRRGKGAVSEFFTAFGSTMEIEECTPLAFAANDADVPHGPLPREVASHRQVIEMDLHHLFRFADGRVPAFCCGTEDAAQTEAALRD